MAKTLIEKIISFVHKEDEDKDELEVTISSKGILSVDPDSLLNTKAAKEQVNAARRLEEQSTKDHKAA